MNWKLAIAEERAAMQRIVALLFALADLAECAGKRSRAVRAFLLWALRPAEIVARNFVAGEPDAPPASMLVSPPCDSLAKAMRLASSFRDLARELDRQAKLAFAVRSEAGQAEPRHGDARRRLDTDEFLKNLHRLVLAVFLGRAARRIDLHDTS